MGNGIGLYILIKNTYRPLEKKELYYMYEKGILPLQYCKE